MYGSGPSATGFSTQITAGNAGSPLIIYAANSNCPSGIRSVTVANQTPGTTVSVYFAAGAIGQPVFTVAAGSTVTLPCSPQDRVTLVTSSIGNFSGSIFVHVDSTPLTASGFQTILNFGTPTVSPNGQVTLFSGIILQWGSITAPSDDSAIVTVSFAMTFPNNLFQVVPSVDSSNLNPGAVALSSIDVQTVASSTIGASFSASGGPSGSTVTIRYLAIGN